MKKGLIITGIIIMIAISSVGAGYLLAEKYIGPPSADENIIVTPYEKQKIEEQKQERLDQLLNQGMEEFNN